MTADPAMTARVLCHPLAGRYAAADVFRLLCGDATDVFWLDGGATSYVGAGELWAGSAASSGAEGALDALEAELAALGSELSGGLGLVGWLGYEVLAETMGPDARIDVPRRSTHPDSAFLSVSRAVAVRSDGAAHLLARGAGWTGELEEWRRETVDLLQRSLQHPAPAPAPAAAAAPAPAPAAPAPPAVRESPAAPARVARWRDSDDAYLAKIAECQDAIRAGDAYVLNLTTEVSVLAGGSVAGSGVTGGSAAGSGATRPGVAGGSAAASSAAGGSAAGSGVASGSSAEAAPFDPVAVYLELRASSPSRFGALLRIGGVSLLSSSPELFLDVGEEAGTTGEGERDPTGAAAHTRVRTSPVKGTRARSADPATDARIAAELGADPKERAENTMIVDLMRNDLARVSVPGSVAVTELLAVETLPQVHQLVSTVEGRLRARLGVVDVLRAAFPAGSMTGTPKPSAIGILDRLEGRARGLYAGTFGHLGFDGRAQLAMTIRSIVIEGDRATVGVGGGITALSVPADELAEVKLKARALLDALDAG